jgi:putative membrane protein (TIGR04086 family)
MISRAGIQWKRVLVYGVVMEILVFIVANVVVDPLFAKLAPQNSILLSDAVILGVPSFFLIGLAGFLVARKAKTRPVLHGFLVGVVALVFILAFMTYQWAHGNLRQSPLWLEYNIANAVKILGGILGGLLASRATPN